LGGDQKNYRLRSYPIVLSQSESPTTFVHQYIDETKSKELYLRLVQNEKLSAIGLLAGNLAHELNNPLTGIRSIAQVLSAEVEDLQLQQDLQQIQEAAHRSQAIIHNLMEFSSKKTNPIAHVALDELVEKTVVFLKTALRQHDYRIDLDARSSHIKVDPLMMSQVVFNIINNACQAMKTKGVLKIKTWRDQNHVYFQVEDAGEGIAKENLSKIFEPFFTTKKEGQGTGLGLSLAKKIIEEYGGEISVTSTLGAGAQFTVKLPSVDQ
jgi:signal transduction histidine kinase